MTNNNKKRIIEVNLCKLKYELQYDWPKDTYIQCGKSGIVFDRETGGVRQTAFLEAFPLDTFIRGESHSKSQDLNTEKLTDEDHIKNLQKAETKAWNEYLRYLNCPNHEYKRISDDGNGECIHCGIFHSKILDNINQCSECENLNAETLISLNKRFCTKHMLEKEKEFNKEKFNEIRNQYGTDSNELDLFCYDRIEIITDKITNFKKEKNRSLKILHTLRNITIILAKEFNKKPVTTGDLFFIGRLHYNLLENSELEEILKSIIHNHNNIIKEIKDDSIKLDKYIHIDLLKKVANNIKELSKEYESL